ncbi:hypothetical protein HanXRQr2_Chr15g0689321 [Helianthus annuus]|uniref:Uncharacterized protein n=1 Tax=Helianthus annuus TaxID=4232 RepID=A0A9K3DZC0_HELAN|nr:hypothetical protein HanXRQr2_Chr15g0689321 [Helianthus annuus]KAJ0830935.1 hypothetical protein HanPSC8_Chr15g0661171 [Helianthus annuus]
MFDNRTLLSHAIHCIYVHFVFFDGLHIFDYTIVGFREYTLSRSLRLFKEQELLWQKTCKFHLSHNA